jgi:hypothetical protein
MTASRLGGRSRVLTLLTLGFVSFLIATGAVLTPLLTQISSAQSVDSVLRDRDGDSIEKYLRLTEKSVDCYVQPAPMGGGNGMAARASNEVVKLPERTVDGLINSFREKWGRGVDGDDGLCNFLAGGVYDIKGWSTPSNFEPRPSGPVVRDEAEVDKQLEQERLAAEREAAEREAAAEPDSCETKFLNPLTWIICPVVDASFYAIDKMNEVINTLMTVDTNPIFYSNPSTATEEDRRSRNAYYTAWDSFRKLALGIVIIVALVVIVASAFGLDFLDAYTIRKAVPRVLLAVILIALSWDILEFFVTLSNDIGNGIRAIIYAPFAGFEEIKLGSGELGIANTAFFAGLFFLGIFGLLSFVVTALLAVLVAFLVLVLREMIIVLLIILAPVAIACLILPNTQKFWQFWQNTLTAMLIAFPIIAAFIATGRVFSAVAYQDGTAGTVNTIIAFVAYFLPYFLLPLTFRLAGGLLATLGNVANNSERGAFDRLKKFRQGQSEKNMAKWKAGERVNGSRYIPGSQVAARGFNAVGVRSGTKRFGLGKQGKEALAMKKTLLAAEYSQSAAAKSGQFKDHMLRAQTYLSESDARKNMASDFSDMSQQEVEAAITTAKANGGWGVSRQVFAAKQLAAVGTGYKNEKQFYETIARVAGGNSAIAEDLVGEMRGTSERAGRNDFKASYSSQTAILKEIMANKGKVNSAAEVLMDEAGVEAARSADNTSLMRNKPQSVENLVNRMTRSLERKRAIINDTSGAYSVAQKQEASMQAGQIVAKLENMQSQGIYAPEVNIERIATTMSSAPKTAELPLKEEVTWGREEAGAPPPPPPPDPGPPNPHAGEVYRRERIQSRGYGGPDDPRVGVAPGREDDPSG